MSVTRHSDRQMAALLPGPTDARRPSLGLEAQEYFRLFNVKRLRPVELGPFDFENAPTTGSLWIAEGVTSYYSVLLMTRAGRTAEEIAGVDLRTWFASAVSSTDELDYADLLEWYGLRFVTSWTLERKPDQNAEQQRRLMRRLEQ